MAPRLHTQGGFLHWTLEIPAWTVLVVLVLMPPSAILFGRLAIGLANNDAEHDFPLVRNKLTVGQAGRRMWHGAFQNPTDNEYREISATIRFLDAGNLPVGEVRGQVERLRTGESLPMQGPVPDSAVRMQVYSLQRRTGPHNLGRLFGPYLPWEFGYVLAKPVGQ